MLFSCKISHSILTYLDRQGADLVSLFEACEYPAEFLRNPAHWLDAEKMEDLLAFLMRDYNRFSREGRLIEEAGHACKDLRAWSVLDSVLRMVQSPKDIYAQPDRFMSYFVSPAPPVGSILREPEAVFFELPIASSQYPLVTEYLRAALEALPTYVGKPMSSVQWSEIRVSVNWAEKQESLFGEDQAPEPHLNPEVLQSIVHTLEQTQKQLEETKQLLVERERELKVFKSGAAIPVPRVAAATAATEAVLPPDSGLGARSSAPRWDGLAQGLKAEISSPAQDILNQIYRMNDYMARAQQLVTLLVGQGRETPQVREAMRRVDWPFVLKETPNVVKAAAGGVRKIQDTIKDLGLLAADSEPIAKGEMDRVVVERKVPTDLNRLVARAIEAVKAETVGETAARVQVDQHLLLDREVPVHAKPLERALIGLIKNAIQSLELSGTVRISTRPAGNRAEIEIADSGIGMSEVTLSRATEPFFTTQAPGTAAGLGLSLAQSIIRAHDGSLALRSQPGRGTTVVISLPINPSA